MRYFTGKNNHEREHVLLRYNIKTGKSEPVMEEAPSLFNIIDDKVYYTNHSVGEGTVYAYDLEKKTATKVLDYSPGFILDENKYIAYYFISLDDKIADKIPKGAAYRVGSGGMLLIDKKTGEEIIITDNAYSEADFNRNAPVKSNYVAADGKIAEYLEYNYTGRSMYIAVNIITSKKFDPAPNYAAMGEDFDERAEHSLETIELTDERMLEIGGYFRKLIEEIEASQ